MNKNKIMTWIYDDVREVRICPFCKKEFMFKIDADKHCCKKMLRYFKEEIKRIENMKPQIPKFFCTGGVRKIDIKHLNRKKNKK